MNTPALIRAIRGVPLTVLAVLFLNRGRTIGTQEIVAATGYSAPTVTSALKTLQALNLAQNHARYNGWQTTDAVRQLVLGEAEPAVEIEAKTFCLPAGRSSGSHDDLDADDRSDRRRLQPSEARTFCFPDEWQDLVQLLVERCAAPPAAARRAIARAHKSMPYPSHVRHKILRWLAYCLSDHGKGIKNVGAFVTSRIANDIPCPDWFHTPMGELGREIRLIEWAWQKEEEEPFVSPEQSEGEENAPKNARPRSGSRGHRV
jgi:hypothetical protein